MSLFDVIRYPISTPPSREELNALPRDLLAQWMSWVGFDHTHEDSVGRVYRHYTRFSFTLPIHNELQMLRQMIRDLP